MSLFLDPSKLPAILERYYSSPEIMKTRLVGRDRKFPSAYFDIVRFFGPEHVDPSEVALEYLPGSFEFTDQLIAEFSRQIETELRRQGRLYDGPTVVSLHHFDMSRVPYRLIVQEARYVDQCAGFALDLTSPLFSKWGGTLRNYYKAKYPSLDARDSPLAICFGICGLVIVSENDRLRILFVKRSRRLASLEDSIGPSVAGSIEYEPRYSNLRELIEYSLGKEIEEELGLERHEFTIIPLAYAREIFRGDRPQLLCLIRTTLSASEIKDRLLSLDESRREFDDAMFAEIDDDGELRADMLSTLNFEAVMNWYLAEEYFGRL
ncbi:MAG: hypothetical protein AB1644_04180 [Candidatus Zixiibacteriota bacterium]